jgi:hypothetical protein
MGTASVAAFATNSLGAMSILPLLTLPWSVGFYIFGSMIKQQDATHDEEEQGVRESRCETRIRTFIAKANKYAQERLKETEPASALGDGDMLEA